MVTQDATPSRPLARAVLSACVRVLLLLAVFFTATDAGARAALDASVNQRSMQQDETLTLTVKGQVELELNLGTFINLRNLDFPEPDLGDLPATFDILDQRQSYSLRSINGENSAEVTWVYRLAPRKTGELTIPSLKFKGTETDPIVVEVKPGNSSQTDSRRPNAWIESEVSKDEAFVQEQLVYTVRLYFLGSLMGGNLSEPEIENAIVEPLGDQQRTTEFIDDRRYQVVERRYLVYPQRSGPLTLPALNFSGRQRDPANGTVRFLRAQSDPHTVEVSAPPGDFPGDQWLAAESLVLDEDWSRSPDTLQVGDSLSRVLTLRTLGLLESALPLLEDDYPEQFNAYPEGPRSETEINGDTIEASQVQTTALVAVKPGKATLPEIRLHWWDTLNDVARVAVIPERTVEVMPAPGADFSGEPSTVEADEEREIAEGGAPSTAAPDSSPFNAWLAALAVFFALGWLLTLVFWLRRRPAATAATGSEQPPSHSIDLATLKQHASSGSVETLGEIPVWVRQTFRRPDIRTLKDTRAFFQDPELDAALDALEQYHFDSRRAHGADAAKDKHWCKGTALASTLERLSKTRPASSDTGAALPPFRKVPE